MVTENKLGMPLAGDCPAPCGANEYIGCCDWMGDYTECPVYKASARETKKVSFRIRRIYYDQIVAGTKREELRKDSKFWRKRLIKTDTPPKIAVFVCGADVHRREISKIRIDTPENVLGRELSEQGKKDIPTSTCIVVELGDEIVGAPR